MARTPKVISSTTRILVLVSNVWYNDVKWYQYDVLDVENDVAELMIEKNQGKVTKDDLTVIRNADGNREAV
jgi:hypothetical protein